MASHFLRLAAVALTVCQLVQGQTYTDCNPTKNSTCPSDAALGKTISVDFTQGESSYFTNEEGTNMTYGTNGAEFIITSEGLARTIISTKYIMFGRVNITLRAASGTGIVSSVVMESDDLDEIDLEWLGGNTTVVESNYFGKDNTTSYDRAIYHRVSDPQDTWHTYTVDWTSERTNWYIDNVLVRTLLYASANDGTNYPQTPMRIKLGNWVGGAADESTGTVEWAGGYTDLDDAPFTMYVKNITIQDYTTSGDEYTYSDESGSYTSIVVTNSTTNSSTTVKSTGTSSSNSTSSSSESSTSSSSTSTVTSGGIRSNTLEKSGFVVLSAVLGFACFFV